jgi:hypothetical protein
MALVGTITPANDLNFRNKIINGDMRIWQRATSYAAFAGSNTYTVDRFSCYNAGSSTVTVARDTDVPANQGFLYSHKSTVSATASTSAYYTILQRIEGNQILDFFAGRTGCVAHTISFWFKTSVMQTYSGSARIASASSCYAFDFTPTAINTWTKVVVNIPANTTQSMSGYLDTSEAYSLCITPFLNLNVGLNGTANTWTSSNLHASSNVGGTWGNTSGATFYLTGVQIERGNVASDFEFRPYSTELQLCQRYFEKSFDDGTAPQNGTSTHYTRNGLWCGYSDNSNDAAIIVFKVTKRTTPSMGSYGNSSGYWFANGGFGPNAAAFSSVGTTGSVIRQQSVGGLTVTNGHWTASAEL